MFNPHKLLRQLLCRLMVTLFLAATLFASPVTAAPLPDATTAQILQVIQEHPKIILDTLVNYQQQLERERTQAKQAVVTKYQKDPAALIKRSAMLGNRASGRYVVEFSDFQCPFCRDAHDALNRLHQQNPDVAIVYKHFPLVQIHDQAMPAAQAAWAAGKQGKFWEFHDRLFEQQANLSDQTFSAIAEELGLNRQQFELDRTSKAAIAAITDDLQVADTLGVQGTPLFLVIGKTAAEVIPGGDFDAINSALKRV